MKIKLLRILLAGVFVFGLFSMAQAAKPQNSGSDKDVIAMSNGFPSGLHFNLNVSAFSGGIEPSLHFSG